MFSPFLWVFLGALLAALLSVPLVNVLYEIDKRRNAARIARTKRVLRVVPPPTSVASQVRALLAMYSGVAILMNVVPGLASRADGFDELKLDTNELRTFALTMQTSSNTAESSKTTAVIVH
jgi:hypothetical protein